MIRDHSRIEEMLAVRALDGLDGDDTAALEHEMNEHGPDCPDCRRLEDELAETAGMLALSLDPLPVDPGMADRILGGSAASSTATPQPPPIGVLQETGRRDSRRRSNRAWVALIGVAAAFLLIVAIVVADRPAGPPQVVTATSAQRFVAFAGQGELAMAYTPGEPGVVLWGHGLPDPGRGNTFEVWMIRGDAAVSGGCVAPTDGRLAAYVDADVGDATDLMAVTIEPDACPNAPTQTPWATADIS
jgi:anti-sigma-K factor RskA